MTMKRGYRQSSIAASAIVFMTVTAITIGPLQTQSMALSLSPTTLSTTTTLSKTSQRRQSKLGSVHPNNNIPCRTNNNSNSNNNTPIHFWSKLVGTALLSATLLLSPAAHAEDELLAKYGGKGFDSSLVDQTCLVDKCSLQAKACLADDPSCRKGLTCTAKCLGDNACITGCMARYGDVQLDNLLKCTIEDHECIKIAILDGGADSYGQEPRSPAPTVQNMALASMEGSWYKVIGFNPNYDCYACQRNTFTSPNDNANQNNNNFHNANLFAANNKLLMDVEFSMPHLLPDGSPPPPKNQRETIAADDTTGLMMGSKSIALNDYETHETMIFDSVQQPLERATNLILRKGTNRKATYSRTAHSEGEMFGLKFWENWYILGQNNPDEPEFKFVYYNGKTRQNTYSGAFVYSRSKELPLASMSHVYQIATDAGMNPDQFCKIRNGCFADETLVSPQSESSNNPLRGILASTKISQWLGVEPVAAEGVAKSPRITTSPTLSSSLEQRRAWWYEVGDYLENPHRHFQAMDSQRVQMEWPEDVKGKSSRVMQQ